MINRRPIFVNGFSRGGTTMLTNLLASHPSVCHMGETHHVFKGTSITDTLWGVLRKCIAYDAPIIFRERQNYFSPRWIHPRKMPSVWTRRRIDEILFHEKVRSKKHRLLNRFRSPDVEYTDAEIAAARLLCKNIDGMVYTNDALVDMYPDATCYGLVRNGFALCEGHLRRGRSAAEIGWRYQVLVDKMLNDAARMQNYRMLRFEDLLAAPFETLETACRFAELNPQHVEHVRVQARRVMDADGNHRLTGRAEWEVQWLRKEELPRYFRTDVDANQIKRLSRSDRDAFLRQAGRAMERLGYLGDTAIERDAAKYFLPIGSEQPIQTRDAA